MDKVSGKVGCGMFSSAQLLSAYFITLFVIYAAVSKMMDIIKFNKYCKMWSKYYEVIKSSDKWYTIPKPMMKEQIKGEIQNECDKSTRDESKSEA